MSELDIKLKKVYNVSTLCRSGNHAIIFWMMNNIAKYTKFINGCVYYNPEESIYFYNNCNHINYTFIDDFNYMIKSYEDAPYEKVKDRMNDGKKIIILRDFMNMLASRFKKYNTSLGFDHTYLQKIEDIIYAWKTLAKESLLNEDIIFILYNRWLVDEEYRNDISDMLDIENKNDDTTYVSHIGEGSSFCGLKREHSKINYVDRYKHIKIPDSILNIVKADKELYLLNKLIFNHDIIDECNINSNLDA